MNDRTLVTGAVPRALLFRGEEDCGIVPVEAQAVGVPVIAYAHSGTGDSVLDGVTSVLFDEQRTAGLASANAEVLQGIDPGVPVA
jgi:glycosyltransferase involved in cell wall biosynthesis